MEPQHDIQPTESADPTAGGLFELESAPQSQPQASPTAPASVGQPVAPADGRQASQGGNDSETAAASEGSAPWEPAELPEHMKPEDAYGAARYWQSRHDRAMQAAEALRQQQEQLGEYSTIAREIMQDPDLLGVLADHVRARRGAPSGDGQVAPAEPQFQAPPPPPEDFYSEDGEKWFKQFRDWSQQTIAAQQAELAALKQNFGQYQQTAQQQQQAAQIEQAVQEAMYQHGLSRPEATAFVQDLTQGKITQDPGLLVQAWRARQRPSAAQVRQQQGMQNAQQRQQQRTPPMASAAGGSGAPPPQGEGLFVERQGMPDPYAPRR